MRRGASVASNAAVAYLIEAGLNEAAVGWAEYRGASSARLIAAGRPEFLGAPGDDGPGCVRAGRVAWGGAPTRSGWPKTVGNGRAGRWRRATFGRA